MQNPEVRSDPPTHFALWRDSSVFAKASAVAGAMTDKTKAWPPAPLRRRHVFGAFAAHDSGVSQTRLRPTRLSGEHPPSPRLWRTRRTSKHVFLRNEPTVF